MVPAWARVGGEYKSRHPSLNGSQVVYRVLAIDGETVHVAMRFATKNHDWTDTKELWGHQGLLHMADQVYPEDVSELAGGAAV